MNVAVVFAGGTGERMGAKAPKQFLELDGKPVLAHTPENRRERHVVFEPFLLTGDKP